MSDVLISPENVIALQHLTILVERVNAIFEQVGQLTERVATLERIGVLERERRGER